MSQERMAPQESKELVEHLETQDQLVLKDDKEQLEPLARQVFQESQAQLDHKDPEEPSETQDQQESQDQGELKDSQVQMVT